MVNIDQPLDVRPFAQLARRLEPALLGPRFAEVFQPFQRSMGLDRVPEQLRLRVLAGQRIRAELVVGYWQEVMRTDPQEMQERIDEVGHEIACPYLAVFGRGLEESEREATTALIPDVQIEEWPGAGHFVHLAELERFSERLRRFIEACAANQESRSTK